MFSYAFLLQQSDVTEKLNNELVTGKAVAPHSSVVFALRSIAGFTQHQSSLFACPSFQETASIALSVPLPVLHRCCTQCCNGPHHRIDPETLVTFFPYGLVILEK